MKIGTISFTNREIDIISCIISGRSAKYIASIIEISPRTVSVHIANIMKKIGGGSQEHIINFVEASNLYGYMKRHYIFLLYAAKLKKSLLDMPNKLTATACYFYQVSNSDFAGKVKTFLEALGVDITEIQDFSGVEFLKNDLLFIPFEHVSEALNCPATKVVISDAYDKRCENYQLVCNENDFFSSFLKIIAGILKDGKIEKFADSFDESYKIRLADNQTKDKKADNKKYYLLASFVIVFLSIYIGTKLNLSPWEVSNISLFDNSRILDREEVINRIDKALKTPNGFAVINGEGGAGKTIIARKYLKSSGCEIIWEINAESRESIIKSLFDLATTLGEQNEQKLPKLILSESTQISKLLAFVSNRLRGHSWAILYDNVENLNDISKYFPDRNITKGKIIITTRNSNVKDIIFLEEQNIVNIGFLNKNEKEDLFKKIFGTKTLSGEFLEEIPSLPLDICAAAYYMKETGDSGNEYVQLLRSSNSLFNKNQTELLGNNLNYPKTRDNIIISGLKKVLEIDDSYKKLALLLCMMGSQRISKVHFYKVCDSFVVNRFMYDLKKYSIINEENGFASIHRLSQDISLNYLLILLSKEEISKFLDDIVKGFCNYKRLAWFLYESTKRGLTITALNDLYVHYNAFLRNMDKLPLDKDQKEKASIKVQLAILHASKYIASPAEIVTLAKRIISQNANYNVIKDLDLAVLYEICGRKSIRVNNVTAIKCFQKCLELCKKTKKAKCLEAVCLSDYANALVCNHGDMGTAESLLNKAFGLLSPADCFWKRQAKVTIFDRYQYCLSGYYVSTDQLMKVITLGEQLLKEFRANRFFYKTGNYEGEDDLSLFMIRRNMAAAYNRMKMANEALENIKEAQFFLERFSKRELVIVKHKGILELDFGIALLNSGNIHDAVRVLTKTIEEKDETTNFTEIAIGRLFRASALIKLGKYKEALVDCQKFASLYPKRDCNSNSDEFLRAVGHLNFATVYHKTNNDPQALKELSEFFKILKTLCGAILNQKTFDDLVSKKIFEMDKIVDKNFAKAQTILSSMYGKS